MREIIKSQPQLGVLDIDSIKPDIKSRDEIDKISFGLIHIYSTPELREKVFAVLNRVLPPKISKKMGRPGMEMWQIFVLAVFRNACNIDYDKLHNLANNHKLLRQLLGHSGAEIWSSSQYYHIQTIKDNVSLLSDEIINEINAIVVEAGHKLLSNKKKESLNCSVDSFVVKTDVHYPTDINLLYDSIRKLVEILATLCFKYKITDLRQSKHNLRKVKKHLYKVQNSKRSRNEKLIVERHHTYIDTVQPLLTQTKEALRKLQSLQKLEILDGLYLLTIEEYITFAEKHIDLIQRRVFKGEEIQSSEKIFSIFEPHTRWISKGKAGVSVEFGLPVTIIKDQFGYILSHIIMETTSDVDVAVEIARMVVELYSNIYSISYDKGFWSPENYAAICKLIEKVIMPKKGKANKVQQEEYDSPEFKKFRAKHSSVESAINRLEYNGLDKCLDHGIDGFKRYVSISIVSNNIHNLGSQLMKKELKKQKRKRKPKPNQAA
ncbi:MAG: ISNCY family transposase [Flavobacterium sp.]|nr:ISNCY family transposase [Flavobacterium sp.]